MLALIRFVYAVKWQALNKAGMMMAQSNIISKPMPVRGYIEGYFGTLLTFSQRLQLVETMSEIGSSFWLYAPKEDPLHRIQWRVPYSNQWLDDFQRFTQQSKDLSCDVIAGLAPGLSMDFADEQQRAELMQKYMIFIAHGASSVALLMDDIETRGLPIDTDLALQQLALLNLMRDNLAVPIYFCPSIYCSAQIAKHDGAKAYLETLSGGLKHHDTKIFWSGNAVVSQSILSDDMILAKELFGKNCIIWDNFYANDYTPWQVRLAPFTNRSEDLSIGINPTGLFFVDQIILEYFKHWHKQVKLDLVATLVSLQMPTELAVIWDKYYQFDAGRDYTTTPFLSMTSAVELDDLKSLIYHLQHWVGPMKLQFYPFFLLLKKRMQSVLNASDDLDNL